MTLDDEGRGRGGKSGHRATGMMQGGDRSFACLEDKLSSRIGRKSVSSNEKVIKRVKKGTYPPRVALAADATAAASSRAFMLEVFLFLMSKTVSRQEKVEKREILTGWHLFPPSLGPFLSPVWK